MNYMQMSPMTVEPFFDKEFFSKERLKENPFITEIISAGIYTLPNPTPIFNIQLQITFKSNLQYQDKEVITYEIVSRFNTNKELFNSDSKELIQIIEAAHKTFAENYKGFLKSNSIPWEIEPLGIDLAQHLKNQIVEFGGGK